jgi:hypothetical protein
MLLKNVFSGKDELERTNTQEELIQKALQALQEENKDVTLILETGTRIIFSRVIEGGDSHLRYLSVHIR